MSDFLGSRISLISKSDIRYVGTLHEINSDESTVSLENVRSFGTEGRRGRPEDEVAPSDQVYEYIVFRGSDVKDLRIEEQPSVKENKPPPAMPDDPAIVGARARVGAPSQSGPPAGGNPQHPFYPNNFYGGPPPPASWGRGGGPGGPMPVPGAGFGMSYPPPPHWFPPGQGFPGGPGPWNNHPPPPGAAVPPVSEPQRQRPGPPLPPVVAQEAKAGSVGPGSEPPQPISNPLADAKAQTPAARPPSKAPSPPIESKPSVEQVKAAASTLSSNGSLANASTQSKPTSATQRNSRVTPVMPLSGPAGKPFSLPTSGLPGQSNVKATVSAAAPSSVEDATSAARAAVAAAMAQLGKSGGNATDNLTNKVNEMRVNANRTAPATAASRGRGRGGRAVGQKVEVPDSDFDFAQSNAKFNREEIAKEAIAGSPVTEHANEPSTQAAEIEVSQGNPVVAYNKSRSFFDNISSEAKDRAENSGYKPGGREWRGEEQRKNMETFGQGSVDGGHRNYRGRGRGRGNRGRGYGRGPRGANHSQFQPVTGEQ